MSTKYLAIKNNIVIINNFLYPRVLKISDNQIEVIPTNSTGIFIMLGCDGTRDEGEIISGVANYYGVEEKQIESDVKLFIHNQIEKGVISVSPELNYVEIDNRGNENIVLPYQLSIETTNQCQLKCKHCYNISGVQREGELEAADIIDILKQYKKLGGTSVMLTGGEIFLKKDIEDVIEYVYNNFFRIMILSNGYTITNEMLKVLIKTKDKIALQISIDGMERTHDSIRGVKGAFSETIKNITRLVSNGVQVSVAFTLNEENKDELFDIIELAKELGCFSINIGAVSKLGRAIDNDLFSENILHEYENLIAKARAKYEDEKFSIGRSVEEINDEQENKFSNKCGAGYKILHIFSNGRIGLCPSSSSVATKLKLGDLKSQTLEEILNVDNFKTVMDIPNPSRELCGDCVQFQECAQCIVTMLGKTKEECLIVRSLYEKKLIN